MTFIPAARRRPHTISSPDTPRLSVISRFGLHGIAYEKLFFGFSHGRWYIGNEYFWFQRKPSLPFFRIMSSWQLRKWMASCP